MRPKALGSACSIHEALREARQTLAHEDASREAELLLQYTLSASRAYLYSHAEDKLSHEQLNHYRALINKRSQGVPIAYMTGQREFWSLDLTVTPDTLIPRPDTELLVETTLSLLDASLPLSILDLGTGSGAIALALATERPQWLITACDLQPAALAVAASNAKRLGLSTITFMLSDWFQAYNNVFFHAIVANPPYLSAQDPHLQQGDLRFEPQSALISGQDGLEALHFIIKHSYNHLYKEGILLVEHGCNQGDAVKSLLSHYGYTDIRCWRDLQGHERVSGGKRICTKEKNDNN